jgi:tetratricopeptide (TPR) repeat protein
MKQLALAIATLACLGYAGQTPETSPSFPQPWPVNSQDAPLIDRAMSFVKESRYTEAILLLQEALEIQRGIEGAELQAAKTSSTIATALIELERPDEAEPYLRATLEITLRRLGKKHPMTAIALKGFGDLHMMRRDFDEAESAYSQAVTILEKTKGDPHELPLAMLGLGRALLSKGEDRKAESVSRRCLPLFDGQDDVARLGKVYVNQMLAVTEFRRGRIDEALILMTGTLREMEPLLGPDHVQIGSTALEIARLHLRKKDLASAEPMLSRALQIYESFLGRDHPSTVEVWKEYAGVLGKVERSRRLDDSARSRR